MDTVIDGVNCIQQRRDPKDGAQDLQTLAWGAQSLAAIYSSSMGGYLTDQGLARYSFYQYAVVSLVGGLTALMMSESVEKNQEADENVEKDVEEEDQLDE